MHLDLRCFFFFSSRRRHTRCGRDWSSDVCSSDLELDVRQFEAEVASPAASVADFERQVAQQENALSVLVGHNPGAIARGRALTEMAASIPVPAGVPSALLGKRPDVRGAAASLRAATA